MKIRTALITLLAMISTSVGLVATAPPSQAAGCYGTGCDRQGPQGNGCFADDKVLGRGGGYAIELRYSPSCHAMWAYSINDPNFWDVELHLEMQRLNDAGNWVAANPPRLVVNFEANGGPDWTNALGARTNKFRFRALWVDPQDPGSLWATPWGRGGQR